MTASSNILPFPGTETTIARRVLGEPGPFGFPQAIQVGNIVYVGGQIGDGGSTDIKVQTATSFDGLVASLKAAGTDMRDLINLRTYYVYGGGTGRDVTDFWEGMTAVRLRYLANPGPAATAVRVAGVPAPGNLIGVDGVAVIGGDRQRIMPEHAWDWSIPTPFSQGWRVGDTVYLGGQISADRQGKAVAPGDVAEQTRVTLEFIRHVLADGGADWSDLATMRICYQASGSQAESRKVLDTILEVIGETLPAPLPTLTAFGVDLLYEGLMLEIDGIAIKRDRQQIAPPGADTWVRFEDFPVAWKVGNEIHVGGLSAPGGASLAAQTEASLDRLGVTLNAVGADFESLVKLTVFYVPESEDAAADIETINAALTDYLPSPGPVVTIVRAAGLPHLGQKLQLDAVAIG